MKSMLMSATLAAFTVSCGQEQTFESQIKVETTTPATSHLNPRLNGQTGVIHWKEDKNDREVDIIVKRTNGSRDLLIKKDHAGTSIALADLNIIGRAVFGVASSSRAHEFIEVIGRNYDPELKGSGEGIRVEWNKNPQDTYKVLLKNDDGEILYQNIEHKGNQLYLNDFTLAGEDHPVTASIAIAGPFPEDKLGTPVRLDEVKFHPAYVGLNTVTWNGNRQNNYAVPIKTLSMTRDVWFRPETGTAYTHPSTDINLAALKGNIFDELLNGTFMLGVGHDNRGAPEFVPVLINSCANPKTDLCPAYDPWNRHLRWTRDEGNPDVRRDRGDEIFIDVYTMDDERLGEIRNVGFVSAIDLDTIKIGRRNKTLEKGKTYRFLIERYKSDADNPDATESIYLRYGGEG